MGMRRAGAVLVAFLAPAQMGAQSILTVAGGAVFDGRPATASIVQPYALAVDDGGNIFVAEGRYRVRRIVAKSGLITAFAGTGAKGVDGDGGPATQATLGSIGGLALRDGHLYISDADHRLVRSVDLASGVISTVVANGPAGVGLAVDSSGRFYFPLLAGHEDLQITSLAVDANDRLYAATTNPNRIVRVESSGTLTTIADATDRPNSIAFDRSGDLYFGEVTPRVRFIDPGGVIHPVLDQSTLGRSFFLDAIAFMPDGSLLISDAFHGHLVRAAGAPPKVATIAGNGLVNGVADGSPATASLVTLHVPFLSPNGHYDAENTTGAIAVSPSGDLYIGDTFHQLLRRIDGATGTIATVLSGVQPRALSFAADGALFFLDGCGVGELHCQIQRFDPITGKTTILATLMKASALAVDASGGIVYADPDARRIVRIGSGGTTTVVADQIDATGIATDGGRIYFAVFKGIFVINESGAVQPLWLADDFNYDYAGLRKHGGNLYAAWPACACVLRIDDHGTATVVAGPETGAALSIPNGVDVTRNGDLFIADVGNDRIRAVPACAPLNSFVTKRPSAGESSVSASPLLSWDRVRSGAGTPQYLWDATIRYDVYLDTANPPLQVVAHDIGSPSYAPSNLQPLTTYYWRVVAKGDSLCAPVATTATAVSSFTTTGVCSSPAVSASQTGGTITIDANPAIRSFDLYAGATNPPPLYARGLAAGATAVPGLAAATTYYWRVVAHAACDPALTNATPVRSFVTPGSCVNATPPALVSPIDGDSAVPSAVTLRWSPAAGAASYDVDLDGALYASQLSATSVNVEELRGGSAHEWRVIARSACGTSTASSAQRRFTVARCEVPDAPSDVEVSPAIGGSTYVLRWSGHAGSFLVERAADPQFTTIIDRQRTRLRGVTFLADEARRYFHRVAAVAACGAQSPFGAVVASDAAVGDPVVVFTVLPQALVTRIGESLDAQPRTFTLENLSDTPVEVLVAAERAVSFLRIVDLGGDDPSAVTLQPHRPHDFAIFFSAANDRAGYYEARISVMSRGKPLRFTPQAYVSLRVGGDPGAATPQLLVDGLPSAIVQFPPWLGNDDARPPITVDLLNDGAVSMQAAAELSPDAWLKLDDRWSSDAVPPHAIRSIQLSTLRNRAVGGSSLPRYTNLTLRNLAGQTARLLVEDDGGTSTAPQRSAPPVPGERSIVVQTSGSMFLTNTGGDPAPADLIDSSGRQTSLIVPPDDLVRLTENGPIEVLSPRLDQLVIRAGAADSVSGARTGGDSNTPLFADGLEHGASVVIDEYSGRNADVTIRLYEPGIRSAAIAQKTFTLAANGELSIANLFAVMGLESGPDDLDKRNRDEIDVLAVLTSSGGIVSARALLAGHAIAFAPAGGGEPITTAPPARRRPVGQ